MIPDRVEQRLRAHVAAVLAASLVPARSRDDVAEELYGHLVERWRNLVGDGLPHEVAVDRAIAGFGSPQRIGRELMRTYRGRLWASTVGSLLPAARAQPHRPRSVTIFAVQAFALSAIYAGMAGWALVNHSPLRALLFGLGGVAVSGALLLVGFGLLRAQRWSVVVAIVGSIVLVFQGMQGLFENTYSLSALLAGLSLVVYAGERREVERWLSPTATPRAAVAAVIVVLALPALAPVAGAIPDPTQASPDDLELSVRVDCDAEVDAVGETAVGERVRSVERGIVIAVDFTWRRTSLLPSGIAEYLPVDNLVVEAMPMEWTMIDVALVDTATGTEVPGAGGLGPGGPDRLEERAWSASIPRDELRPGRTIRFTIMLSDGWIGPRTLPRPTEPIRVSYWHANNFVVERTAGCA